MMPQVGSAVSTSRLMSPGWLAPISTTAIWCSGFRPKRVFGTPMSLLKLPCVQCTRYFSESTAATSSLVVVLPLVPVMPITGMSNCRRCSRANAWNVARQSSTSMYLLSVATSGLSTTAYAQPFSSAAAANLLPSNDSPLRAKNIAPAGQLRLSVVIVGCSV